MCDKPDGIRAVITETEFDHSGAWGAEDVRDQALAFREAPPMDGATLRWHLLFPAGGYDDDSVLGVAVKLLQTSRCSATASMMQKTSCADRVRRTSKTA